MSNFTLIKPANLIWQNGQPYSVDFSDIYFSSDQGLEESRHVFIDANCLIERWSSLSPDDKALFVIGETGFGTGLNFLLAWSLWEKTAPANARLHFISCEKHPLLSSDLARCIGLWPDLAFYAKSLLAMYPVMTPGFHRLEFAEGRVTLNLMIGDALSCYQELLVCGDPLIESALPHNSVDAWFLDGFSPNKNPDLWSDKLMAVLSLLSKKGTTLSTFSAAAVVKAALCSAGFEVSKQNGYGKKRDMIVAQWQRSSSTVLKRQTPWHVSRPLSIRKRHAIVIGAGLAGCCAAFSLAKRGWHVTVLEAQSDIAQGASGNPRAVLFPTISAYSSPLTRFMLNAFLYAHDFYQHCLQLWPIGDLSGLLQFTRHADIRHDLTQWLKAYPSLGYFVDKNEASELAGVPIHTNALYVPKAGWIDSKALCERLIRHPNIELHLSSFIPSLNFELETWHVAEHSAEVVIVASGYQANQFTQTKHLRFQAVRGQMTAVSIEEAVASLKMPICGEGHVVPYQQDAYLIGATFRPDSSDSRCYSSEDVENRSKIQGLPVELHLSNYTLHSWSGIRASTLDHLPIVGPVVDERVFVEQFKSLETDSKRWIECRGEAYLSGLYLFAGFGARGLTSIPLCADYLAELINNGPSVLESTMSKTLSTARFLHRSIIRKSSV